MSRSRVKAMMDELMEYEKSVDGFALQLRLELATIVAKRLRALDWTQAQLARSVGKPESYISSVVHANANCGIATIAQILHALGVKPGLIDSSEVVDTAPQQEWEVITYGIESTEQEQVVRGFEFDQEEDGCPTAWRQADRQSTASVGVL